MLSLPSACLLRDSLGACIEGALHAPIPQPVNAADLQSNGLPVPCRSVVDALGFMHGDSAFARQETSASQPASAGAKGVAKAVVSVGSLYHEKCRPAADALAHASVNLQRIQKALSSKAQQCSPGGPRPAQSAQLLQPTPHFG